jgi:hypothetical protein
MQGIQALNLVSRRPLEQGPHLNPRNDFGLALDGQRLAGKPI